MHIHVHKQGKEEEERRLGEESYLGTTDTQLANSKVCNKSIKIAIFIIIHNQSSYTAGVLHGRSDGSTVNDGREALILTCHR